MSGKTPRFINRELSWLEFNQRVLDEASDSDVPLLERLNFLAITASNLDEFFMVRVGGLQKLAAAGATRKDPAGMTPAQQLNAVDRRTRAMVHDQYACYNDQLKPALTGHGIVTVGPSGLSQAQTERLQQVFNREVFPVITPMAVHDAGAFPLLRNLGLNVAVRLKPDPGQRRHRFAVIPIGGSMARFIDIGADTGYAGMAVEDVVRVFADRLFPGQTVMEAIAFRITRNADLSVREDMAADFLAEMEDVIDKRKTSACVRLEIEASVSRTMLAFLRKALKITNAEVYEVDGPLRLSDFRELTALENADGLKYEPWEPQPSPAVDPKKSIFETIAENSVLLVHPYDAFDPVLRLIDEASRDPDVMAIKQTLYRTSSHSPVIAALERAAQLGKYVTAVVELKARFDEARNIEWARKLEQEGVQVIYGVKGLKTHSKVCLVVRREGGGIARYLHFGTGNYNEKTARLYSDVSYLTRDPDLGTDASAFFNAICGYSEPRPYVRIAAAPTGLRDRVAELIRNLTERRRRGQKAFIRAKMNSLADPELIGLLYEASQAGVKIDLNVRGICCLCPGVKGLSETITVVSIVDRFLEHSRIFQFNSGGEEDVYISSADWMPRNLDRRVELFVPVDDPACRRALVATLDTYFRDTAKSRRLMPDGTYERITPPARHKALRSQLQLCQQAADNVKAARQAKRTVFEPYRAPEAGM